MALQIANPTVVAKIERLARATGLSKTGAVEQAVDALLAKQVADDGRDACARMDAILAQLDRIPDQKVPFDPLTWDEHGLPG
jgi:antitoxin VapB